MNALLRLIKSLRYATAAFFKYDLALQRGAGGLHIVLEERSQDPAKPAKPGTQSRSALSDRKLLEEMTLISQQLGTLLDEQPETRQTLRHLVFVEKALAKKGLRVLHKLPLDVLQRSHEQLESLVTNWSPVGLASLRSKMAVAILDREHHDPDAEGDVYRTAAVLDTILVELPSVDTGSDDAALAAAYAALGTAAPGVVEMQPELGSPSARAVAAPQPRVTAKSAEIALRELPA